MEQSNDDDDAFVISVEDGVGEKGELGLTTLDFGEVSGLVRSAKIRIDSAALDSNIDLDVVMAHELGHYIGLAHSKEAGSVMRETYASIDPASAKHLSADDTSAVCALYPPLPVEQLPRSCSMSRPDGDPTAPLIVTTGCLFVAMVRRRHFASAVISAGESARE